MASNIEGALLSYNEIERRIKVLEDEIRQVAVDNALSKASDDAATIQARLNKQTQQARISLGHKLVDIRNSARTLRKDATERGYNGLVDKLLEIEELLHGKGSAAYTGAIEFVEKPDENGKLLWHVNGIRPELLADFVTDGSDSNASSPQKTENANISPPNSPAGAPDADGIVDVEIIEEFLDEPGRSGDQAPPTVLNTRVIDAEPLHEGIKLANPASASSGFRAAPTTPEFSQTRVPPTTSPQRSAPSPKPQSAASQQSAQAFDSSKLRDALGAIRNHLVVHPNTQLSDFGHRIESVAGEVLPFVPTAKMYGETDIQAIVSRLDAASKRIDLGLGVPYDSLIADLDDLFDRGKKAKERYESGEIGHLREFPGGIGLFPLNIFPARPTPPRTNKSNPDVSFDEDNVASTNQKQSTTTPPPAQAPPPSRDTQNDLGHALAWSYALVLRHGKLTSQKTWVDFAASTRSTAATVPHPTSFAFRGSRSISAPAGRIVQIVSKLQKDVTQGRDLSEQEVQLLIDELAVLQTETRGLAGDNPAITLDQLDSLAADYEKSLISVYLDPDNLEISPVATNQQTPPKTTHNLNDTDPASKDSSQAINNPLDSNVTVPDSPETLSGGSPDEVEIAQLRAKLTSAVAAVRAGTYDSPETQFQAENEVFHTWMQEVQAHPKLQMWLKEVINDSNATLSPVGNAMFSLLRVQGSEMDHLEAQARKLYPEGSPEAQQVFNGLNDLDQMLTLAFAAAHSGDQTPQKQSDVDLDKAKESVNKESANGSMSDEQYADIANRLDAIQARQDGAQAQNEALQAQQEQSWRLNSVQARREAMRRAVEGAKNTLKAAGGMLGGGVSAVLPEQMLEAIGLELLTGKIASGANAGVPARRQASTRR